LWRWAQRQGAGEEEVHAEATAGVHREPADLADWLIAAEFVKPFVKLNKNDFVDAGDRSRAKAILRMSGGFSKMNKTDDPKVNCGGEAKERRGC
jgi:hypothetical protein